MMDKKYIKKLERVLDENGVLVNGYEMETSICTSIQDKAREQGYDFDNASDFTEEYVNVEIPLNDGTILQVDGSVKRTTKYYRGPDEELPYNQVNINSLYVVESDGTKKDCNFSYSYL